MIYCPRLVDAALELQSPNAAGGRLEKDIWYIVGSCIQIRFAYIFRYDIWLCMTMCNRLHGCEDIINKKAGTYQWTNSKIGTSATKEVDVCPTNHGGIINGAGVVTFKGCARWDLSVLSMGLKHPIFRSLIWSQGQPVKNTTRTRTCALPESAG